MSEPLWDEDTKEMVRRILRKKRIKNEMKDKDHFEDEELFKL